MKELSNAELKARVLTLSSANTVISMATARRALAELVRRAGPRGLDDSRTRERFRDGWNTTVRYCFSNHHISAAQVEDMLTVFAQCFDFDTPDALIGAALLCQPPEGQ